MMSRRITTAVAAFLVVGALGACGSDDDGDDAGPASIEDPDGTDNDQDSSDEGAEGDEADVGLRYAQCMRDNGVNMADPEVGEDGEFQLNLNMDELDATPEEVQAAEAACRDILEEARVDREPLSPEEIAERRDSALALAQCMRERGWDFPDPVVDDQGGIQVQNPDGVGGPGDPNFERFEDDRVACEDEAGMERPEDGGELTESEGPGGSA